MYRSLGITAAEWAVKTLCTLAPALVNTTAFPGQFLYEIYPKTKANSLILQQILLQANQICPFLILFLFLFFNHWPVSSCFIIICPYKHIYSPASPLSFRHCLCPNSPYNNCRAFQTHHYRTTFYANSTPSILFLTISHKEETLFLYQQL